MTSGRALPLIAALRLAARVLADSTREGQTAKTFQGARALGAAT
jgi:hypothetical protein